MSAELVAGLVVFGLGVAVSVMGWFLARAVNRLDKQNDKIVEHGKELARLGEREKAQNGRLGKLETAVKELGQKIETQSDRVIDKLDALLVKESK